LVNNQALSDWRQISIGKIGQQLGVQLVKIGQQSGVQLVARLVSNIIAKYRLAIGIYRDCPIGKSDDNWIVIGNINQSSI
jgi:hypothetical protein